MLQQTEPHDNCTDRNAATHPQSAAAGNTIATTERQTLHKAERLHSRKRIGTLFEGHNSKSLTAYPLRMVYMPMEGEQVSQMLISVPKRLFKRAVQRNRIKRLVREAYRKNKGEIRPKGWAIAWIWIGRKIHTADEVEQKLKKLMARALENDSDTCHTTTA